MNANEQHLTNIFGRGNTPLRCHPAIMAIPEWQKKISFPPAGLARLRRKLGKAGLLGVIPKSLHSKMSQADVLINLARSNAADAFATAYQHPDYHHCRKRERWHGNPPTDATINDNGTWTPFCAGCQVTNEFVTKPELLRLVNKI